jgi:hypothetical protein
MRSPPTAMFRPRTLRVEGIRGRERCSLHPSLDDLPFRWSASDEVDVVIHNFGGALLPERASHDDTSPVPYVRNPRLVVRLAPP